MIKPDSLIPQERIERTIIVLRGQKVMLDADIATLYGVTTRRLKEQVRRNPDRFPPDFMFELTPEETAEVVANCDHLTPRKQSRRKLLQLTVSEQNAGIPYPKYFELYTILLKFPVRGFKENTIQ
jgi:hypothetical protein